MAEWEIVSGGLKDDEWEVVSGGLKDDEWEIVSGGLVEEKEEERNTWDESVMARGQALLDGLTFGFGDEVAAGGRTLVGQVLSGIDPRMEMGDWGDIYERELARGRKAEEIERENAGGTMLGLELAAGLPSSFGLSKAIGLGAKASRAGNAFTGAAQGAGEAALYGFAEGEGSLQERAENIDPAMVALSTGVGGFAGAWMRGSKEAVSTPEIRNKSTGDINKAYSQSNQQVKRGELTIGEKSGDNSVGLGTRAMDTLDYATTRLKTWTKENVGEWAERRLVDAEGQTMRKVAETMQRLDDVGEGKALGKLDAWFETTDNGQVAKKLLHDMGATDSRGVALPPEERKKLFLAAQEQFKNAPETVRKAWDEMYDEIKRLKELDPTWKATGDYMPTMHIGGKAGTTGDYASPVAAFANYMEDITTAQTLAKQFKVSPMETKAARSAEDLRQYANKLTAKGRSDEQVEKVIERLIRNNSKSNTERVISAAVARYDKMPNEMKANLHEALTSAFVRGRKSPNELLRATRAIANSSQLARLSNIILNVSELGVTATNYGIASTLKALPGAIRSAFYNTDKIIDDFGKTIRLSDLGITGQYMGEVATNKGNLLDKTVSGLFSASGVRKFNALMQETTVNAAKNQATALAKRGKLSSLKAANGMSPQEIKAIEKQFAAGNYRHPDVLDFVFRQLTDVHPVSRSSMPKAFNDHPNGRVFYSMLSFMSQQSNLLRENVWQKTAKAYRYGLNTKQGQQALKEAMTYGSRYLVLTAGVAGLFDDSRKTMRGEDVEWDPVESTINQMAQLATFGVVQPRAEQWGGSTVSLLNPAPISMVEDVAGEGVRAITAPFSDEEYDSEKLLKTLQRWTPGVATIDDFYRYMTDGQRLLTEE